MFKATPVLHKALRRLPLSPKQAGVEYYKGNRVGNLGTIDQYGNFSPDWSKIRTYVYPLHGTKNTEVCMAFLPSHPTIYIILHYITSSLHHHDTTRHDKKKKCTQNSPPTTVDALCRIHD